MTKRKGADAPPAKTAAGTRGRGASAAADDPATRRAPRRPGGGSASPEPAAGAPALSGARYGRGLLWLVVVLLVAGAGGALTWSVWPGRTAEALKALEAHVATLEERIRTLEVQFAGLPDAKAVSDAEAVAALVAEKAEGLGNRLDEFQKSLAEIERELSEVQAAAAAPRADPVAREAQAAAEGNAAGLAELRARVETLERPQPTAEGPAAVSEPEAGTVNRTLVVAVGQLREALRGSGPYAAELDVLGRLAGDDAAVARAVDRLGASAEDGIPTLADLRRRFAAVAREVVQDSEVPEDEGWMARVLSRLSAVATVRPTGEDVPGESPEAVVARAEARLEADDLSGAASELEALSGPSAAAAEGWLGDARARLAAEETLKALHVHVVGRIAGDGGPSP